MQQATGSQVATKNRQHAHAIATFERAETELDAIQWYKGNLGIRSDNAEENACYLARHKKVCLIVIEKPILNIDKSDPSNLIATLEFKIIHVGSHTSKTRTLAGAIQLAGLSAIELNGNTNGIYNEFAYRDEDWAEYLSDYGIDINTAEPMTFSDFLTEENMRPVPLTEEDFAQSMKAP